MHGMTDGECTIIQNYIMTSSLIIDMTDYRQLYFCKQQQKLDATRHVQDEASPQQNNDDESYN